MFLDNRKFMMIIKRLLPLCPMNVSDNFHSAEAMSKWLDGNGSLYDTMILEDLVDAPQYLSTNNLPHNWYPAAAVKINNEVYAYPHHICRYV